MALAEAMAVGDLEAARIAHEAISRLLRDDEGNECAEVVDLSRRRLPNK